MSSGWTAQRSWQCWSLAPRWVRAGRAPTRGMVWCRRGAWSGGCARPWEAFAACRLRTRANPAPTPLPPARPQVEVRVWKLRTHELYRFPIQAVAADADLQACCLPPEEHQAPMDLRVMRWCAPLAGLAGWRAGGRAGGLGQQEPRLACPARPTQRQAAPSLHPPPPPCPALPTHPTPPAAAAAGRRRRSRRSPTASGAGTWQS